MLAVVIRVLLAGVLLGSAAAKVASPASSRASLATFGFSTERSRLAMWAALIAAEVGLAAGVAAGSDTAAWLAAGLMAMFAATLVSAILRGKAGAPCACFGSRSTVSWPAVARNVALAAAFASVPFLPHGELTTDQWLALGLGLALLLCAGLAVAVLALAREVGMLRLRLGPDAALEIPDEGPAVGELTDLVDRFDRRPDGELVLVVFTSTGCRVCQALRPAIESLANHPAVAVATFDEVADADVWAELRIPGSPFAVALDAAGSVLAKGTFNNLAQLESVLATAERRAAGRGSGAAVG